ncbi:MAG: nucleoside/nucleotide kinase family protein [Jatrophihabitans sp.]|uniref:nucleoside/nucleotide kinase family protein n=1 Tax=Jatrophihabitans sp. TaxID=1932789 RepID=UPI003913D13E
MDGPPRVTEPLAAVVDRARALISPGKRTLLGIAGAPGAGKSTLVEHLAAALDGATAVVGMDGFHLANVELDRLGRRSGKGAPDTFDACGYAALLARLRVNDESVVYAPLFDRALDEPISSAVPVAREVPLVITEGNYLLLDGQGWSSLRRLLDQVWFLDLPDDVRTHRLVARHERYGMARAVAQERVRSGTDGRNAQLVQATRDRADLIVQLT